MHGGLSPRIQTVAEIAALQKPLVTSDKHNVHIDLMWSDPHVDFWSFGPNIFRDPVGVGVGYVFGPIQIKRFVKKNKLMLIVRGHQPPMSGYERVGKYLLTLFSTAAYRVQNNIGNMGASLVIDEEGGMNIIRIQAGEQLKLKRQRYKMDKGDRYRDCGKPKLKRQQDAIDDRYD
ncbi:phosphoprotein phosphatase 1 domain protein [Oesophagostomum dentatum]|uniref:Phosphoprotein phosphatase 1 domain protein n=1 Tax=Oesophagostomum dentatum TaxID=61180 RepID=A0A0B1TIC3_OESDE|nr:phosphoprotein phosphatase 1 domain protein [Oesophagostomum dentatum]